MAVSTPVTFAGIRMLLAEIINTTRIPPSCKDSPSPLGGDSWTQVLIPGNREHALRNLIDRSQE